MTLLRFQWLKDYQELEEQILYLKWNLNKSKLELDRWVYGDLADIRLEKNSRSSFLEVNIRKIAEEIVSLENQRKELLELISSFKGIDNKIVKAKYIDNRCIEDIADHEGYSVSYVRKRFTEINKTLDFVGEYESRKEERVKKQNEIDYYSSENNQIRLF